MTRRPPWTGTSRIEMPTSCKAPKGPEGGSGARSGRWPPSLRRTTARTPGTAEELDASWYGKQASESPHSYVRLQGFWAKQFSSGPCRSVRGDDIQLHGMGDGALRRRLIKLLSAGWLPHSVFRPGAGPV